MQAMSRGIRGSRLRYHESVMADENAPATKKDLRELEERLSEQMRDMQTELLKARMDVMERRLGEIEKKLLLNPPAA